MNRLASSGLGQRLRPLVVFTSLMALVTMMTMAFSLPPFARPTHAALAQVGQVGPIDSATGFPLWYQDAAGMSLGYCFDPVFCFAGTALPDQNNPVASVPNNFPQEMFYWAAQASTPTNNGGQALMVLGLEATFLPGPGVVDGDQVTFARTRFRIDNLKKGATYTITYPYGVVTFTATNSNRRGINTTTDVGCVPKAAGVACDFTLPSINCSDIPDGQPVVPGHCLLEHFLTWDTFGTADDAPPAGYIGDFSVPHAVTGSPLGTNFFRVEGPDVGGPGVNIVETKQFNLAGRISGVAVTASPAGSPFNTAQAVSLTASDPAGTIDPAATTIYYTTDGTTPTTASPQYNTGTPINITATTTLQYMAVVVDAQGNTTQGPVGTQVYTIDTVPPVVSLTAKPTNPTNNVNPSFAFTAADDQALKEVACSLSTGADAFTACSSSTSYSNLADGSYTFKVRATDTAGNTTMVQYPFTIDTTAGAPVAQLSPPSLNFGSVKRPATSTPKPVTLTNLGSDGLTIASIAIGGANPGDFAIAAKTKTCEAPLAHNGSCTVDVTFTPTARKTRSATLVITDNAAGSPHSVALTGTGL